MIELETTIRCNNILGEGVLWDERSGAALWTDIQGRRLFRSEYPFETYLAFSAPERIGSFGLLDDRQDQVVTAFETGFALYDWASGEHRWLDRPALPPGCRFNDGRVDPNGVFWAGTMVEDPEQRSSSPGKAAGALYRFRHGRAEQVFDGVTISNSLCWSPDGTTMYFADTPRRLIWAFDCDGDSVGNRRTFTETPPGAHPDGSIVDADGCLWNAQWGAGRVVRYTPNGREDLVVDVPAPQVSCVAFGGPDLSLLLVTTARDGMSTEALRNAPDSGSLFVYATSHRGLPETRCRLASASGAA